MEAPPPVQSLLARLLPRDARARRGAARLGEPGRLAPSNRYPHWSTLLAGQPRREADERWLAIRLARFLARLELPVALPDGRPLALATPPPATALLHQLDRAALLPLGPPALAHPQRVESIRRAAARAESMASVALAGHEITTDAANEALLGQRPPADAAEAWAAGVHECLMRDLESGETTPLTGDSLLRMHAIVCDAAAGGTVAGRLRSAREAPEPHDELGGFALAAPPARALEARLDALCDFASGDGGEAGFIHPIARATITRLWIACDRPFPLANALMARLVWRAVLARTGWRVGGLLAPSRVLVGVRGRYPRALHYVLTDEGDATYFVLFQLEVLAAAIEESGTSLGRLHDAEERLTSAVARATGLEPSYRQAAVLARALRQPGARFTVAGHRRAHGVVYETARADLMALASLGLLEQQREGRAFVFTASPSIARTLAAR